MQELLYELFTNQIFYAAVLGWLMAQFIKTVISFVVFRERRDEYKAQLPKDASVFHDVLSSLFWRTGGMPSSHSSMITALGTAIGIEEGVNSPSFLIAFFFATIVIRDAVGVRRTIGILGKKFNELAQKHNAMEGHEVVEMVEVVEGHSTSEVFVGVLLGFFVSICVYLF